ncbi:MAG: ABC transporter permease [Methanomassiliicoccus sp.]|nr:ABC transporter permease [Methanomassiliicoccus sp.]
MSISQMAFFVYVTQVSGTAKMTVDQVALGNALQTVSYSAVFSICSIPGEEKHAGTLPLIMMTPSRIFTVVLGESLFQIVTGIITVAFSLLIAATFFGVSFAQVNLLAVCAVILVTCFAMAGFGLMLGSFGIYLRSSTLLASLFMYVGLVFCGVNFPIDQLPSFLQPISYVLPLSYGVRSLSLAVSGSNVLSILPSLIAMVVIGFIMILIGMAMFYVFEKMARSKGTTEIF